MANRIAAFIADRMSRYIGGGSLPETAAQTARGELSAIYKGNHRSRDSAGTWRITPPPEPLPYTAAMEQAEETITELLKICATSEEKGQRLNANGKNAGEHTAPEKTPHDTAMNGFESMANYARGKQ